ncbi:FAD/NAD(P)-binding domain-containing protein [Myriangium duriaei CBS 260.36]|uniref:FAD/NAD(P)-binding domain-containing protein n=1 Tax=Myriangium duriaei CBS 260.36 TaxID=1168546 RepID=A0A9P4J6H7_9PEZI|nr:FAD/NAD(P)-binding domain-containing protein [Myriangium duriaei CBS 260.36]
MARENQRPLRVAIAGGGIGGLFATLAIHYHCLDKVEINVYEQASQYKEIGAGVGLGVNAAKLVHKIGLGDNLNEIAGHRKGIWIAFRRFDDGGEITTITLDDTKHIRQAPCARSDLLDLLRFAVEKRKAATLHTKKRISKIADQGNSVTIHFEDETTAEADVVIGADGIHSAVRNQFTQTEPVYSGQVAYRGVISTKDVEDWWPLHSYSAMWCGKYRHFLVFPISRNQSLNVVAFSDTKSEEAKDMVESWVTTCDRKEVEDAYKEFDPTVQRLIALMPKEPGRWKINDREPLNQWHYLQGKVILLGDAAHAMLPHLGAGAGQAIEDGWVLGRTLGELVNGTDAKHCGSLEACAAFYQKVRLPRAQKVQNKSREAGATYDMKTDELLPRPYEECVPIAAKIISNQMKFVWEAELDAIYDEAKEGPNHSLNGTTP